VLLILVNYCYYLDFQRVSIKLGGHLERGIMAKAGYAFLIFFAIFGLNLFCAHAQRRLVPGPYSEEDEKIQRCLDLTNSAGRKNEE
jgi:hypothetical protein